MREAELENFRFHDLRHTTASYLAMNGATLIEIAAVLGHKTLQMVKRYSHVTDQHTSAILGKMTGKVFGDGVEQNDHSTGDTREISNSKQ